jgi:enamine deaminase RidA (YjgF/YER057c/UK114 family)
MLLRSRDRVLRALAVFLLSAAPLACAAPLPATVPSAPSAPSVPRVVHLTDDLDAKAHDEWHYAPVVRAGDLVILSGIAAGRGWTDEEKIRNMFERARVLLAAAGASFDDVVELTTFHTAPTNDDFRGAFEIFSKVHATVFHPPYPAWTAIGNAALLNKSAVVEMRVVAVVGSGKGARVQRVARLGTGAP